jgi:hypothetical protein
MSSRKIVDHLFKGHVLLAIIRIVELGHNIVGYSSTYEQRLANEQKQRVSHFTARTRIIASLLAFTS